MKKIFTIITLIGIFLLQGCFEDGNLVIQPEVDTTAIEHIDTTIKSFMEKYALPGAAIAIAKDGKLVYARGYGYADQNHKISITAETLFRVASVSKPITSVAIMKLYEEGKLSLSDTVFGESGILSEYGTLPLNQYEKTITIQHLLEHTAGGKTWNNNDTDGSSAPMFSESDKSIEELITWILDTRDPSDKPGTIFEYSNIGYSVLGRVIEKITGMSYESYVSENILEPIGISNMCIGRNSKSTALPGESFYFDDNYPTAPYSVDIERSDACGGWIASVKDLAKLLVHVDGFDTNPDILSTNTLELMTLPSEINSFYSKGWCITNNNNWWHNGSLPGTSAIIVRTNDGFCWSFLTNKRSYIDGYDMELDMMIWNAILGVDSWPETDLFND